MVLLSDPLNFSRSASPRGLIRTNWQLSFERRARRDGFGGRVGMNEGEPHPNKVVHDFLASHSDASHLFFAIQIIPRLEASDITIDHRIQSLVRRLGQEGE